LAAARLSYDNAAQGYADAMSGGLEGHPDARGALAWFVEALRGVPGSVVDAGCGPGHVTDYLARAGLDVYGADISPRMIEIARQTYPSLRFEVESFTAMGCADEALAGVLSFYSIVHVPDAAMPAVAREFRRVLRPGGVALVGFHEGSPGATSPRATEVTRWTSTSTDDRSPASLPGCMRPVWTSR
jgi:SAM-dependent methyltransferase